jgi:hypothetical protein
VGLGALLNARFIQQEVLGSATKAGSVLMAELTSFSAFLAFTGFRDSIGRAGGDAVGVEILLNEHEVGLGASVTSLGVFAGIAVGRALHASVSTSERAFSAGVDAHALELEVSFLAGNAGFLINGEEGALGGSLSAGVSGHGEDGDGLLGEDGEDFNSLFLGVLEVVVAVGFSDVRSDVVDSEVLDGGDLKRNFSLESALADEGAEGNNKSESISLGGVDLP